MKPAAGAFYFLFGAGSAALTWLLVRLYLRRAPGWGLLDLPNERSSHSRPVPRGGGLGILITFAAAGLAWTFLFGAAPVRLLFSRRIIGVLAGGAAVAAISWLDDRRRGIPPGVRLLVHLGSAIAVVLVVGGWGEVDFPFLGPCRLGAAGLLVAVLWIVGLVNAYNFMDGIDGLAGIQAVSAAAGWLAVGLLAGNSSLAAAAVVIGGAAVGFLFHNRPPAKVFMGDVGSASLGYVFAVLPLVAGRSFPAALSARLPVAGFLMVSPFVVDAAFTFCRRAARREKISEAHRSHLYQRLVLSGLSHATVTAAYFFLGFLGGAAGVVFLFGADRLVSGCLAASSVALIWGIPWIWIQSRMRKTSRRA